MSICKQGCGLNVRWIVDGRKPDGSPRRKCLNDDGTDHWDKCSEMRTKRVMAEGVPFKDQKGEGFIFEGKKKYFHMVATTKLGKPIKQEPK